MIYIKCLLLSVKWLLKTLYKFVDNILYVLNKEFIKIILYVYYQVIIWLLKTHYIISDNVLYVYR